jgi:hypothetical protein
MKLVAILIEDHSFLFEPDQVINLGGKYLYSFKKGSICDSLVIKRTLNPEFIDSFWGENISLASAIVGENGTGKTTIYRELLHNENLILIFEDFESKTSFINNNISNLTTYFKKLNFEDDVYKVTISEINKRDHMGISIMETSLLKPYFKYYSPNMMYNVDLWDLFDEVKDPVILFQ